MSIQRLRSLIPIGLVIVAQVILWNLVLHRLAATPILGSLPKVISGTGYLEDNRQRLAKASEEYAEGRIAPNEYLCVLLGASNLRDDVDLQTLAAEANVSCRFLGLGLTGLMGEVANHARALDESNLRPDLILLGFGPMTLIDRKPAANAMREGVLAYLSREQWRSAAGEVRKWFWFHDRRQDISITIEGALLDARAWMLRACRSKLVGGDAHRSSWRALIASDWPEHLSEASLDEEFRLYGNLGVYELKTYKESTKSPTLLVEMIKQFRAKGADVVLILLPEHSRFRQAVPPEALDVLRAFLTQYLRGDVPSILNYRDAIPDEGLADLMHANAKGRELFSRRLGRDLPRYLPRHPPRMGEGRR
jgi:hypothetical protein